MVRASWPVGTWGGACGCGNSRANGRGRLGLHVDQHTPAKWGAQGDCHLARVGDEGTGDGAGGVRATGSDRGDATNQALPGSLLRPNCPSRTDRDAKVGPTTPAIDKASSRMAYPIGHRRSKRPSHANENFRQISDDLGPLRNLAGKEQKNDQYRKTGENGCCDYLDQCADQRHPHCDDGGDRKATQPGSAFGTMRIC